MGQFWSRIAWDLGWIYENQPHLVLGRGRMDQPGPSCNPSMQKTYTISFNILLHAFHKFELTGSLKKMLKPDLD